MNEKKVIPVKYFYYGMLACVLLICSVFFFLFKRESDNSKALDERGITVDAWVVNLYETKVSKKSSSNYYMEVGFFADTTKAPPTTSIDTNSKPQSKSDKLLEALAKQTASLRQPIGNYETQKIPLPSYDVYKQHNIHDKVKVQFLPEDHSVIRLTH